MSKSIFERMTVEVPTSRYDELVRKENKYEQYKWILEKVSPEHVALVETADCETTLTIIDEAVVEDMCHGCFGASCKEGI